MSAAAGPCTERHVDQLRRERDSYRLAAIVLAENLNDALAIIDVLTSQLLAYRAADAAAIVARIDHPELAS